MPADFINVQRQLLVYGEELGPMKCVKLLEAEVRGRRGDKYQSKAIGFMSKMEA